MIVDPLAIGSDVPRSYGQYFRRKVAQAIVSLARLNESGPLATEITQAIAPVLTIETRHGLLLCRGGHGRLVWRAETFHTEEPETIRWLDRLGHGDVYWDIGANVGLYAIYAAKFLKCRVVAFEPESQNYATLIENMVLNGVDIMAAPLALSDGIDRLGTLSVPYLTKGGAYNIFDSSGETVGGYFQVSPGMSIDEVAGPYCGMPRPTHIKIDVDGSEPNIIAGASEALESEQLKSVLIEIDKGNPRSCDIFRAMAAADFKVESDTPARRPDVSTSNVIFSR